jgi:hypothetical protein
MYITRMKLALLGLDLKPDSGVETTKSRENSDPEISLIKAVGPF